MTVPSTPTATDRQEEVRKLNVEIAGLKSAQEISQRAAEGAEEAAREARTRAEALKATITDLEASQTALSKDLREFVAECRNTLQTVVMAMELAAQSAKDLAAEVDRLTETITTRKQELESVRLALAKEHETMSDKRLDLDIYHQRIKDAAAIHLPGQPVVI